MSVSDALSEAPALPPLGPAAGAAVSSGEHRRWFQEQVCAHEPALKSYLRGAFPSVRDVDDVVQESFLRCWRMRAAQPIRSVRALLFRVARHVAIDVLRRRKASPIDTVPDLATVAAETGLQNGYEAAALRDEVALLVEALESLAPRCREIVILRKFQHLSQKEVAARLGISEETVQEQVYRGLRRCEAFLQRRGVGFGGTP